MSKVKVVILAVVFFLSPTGTKVYAQESSTETLIWEKERLESEIKTVKQTYQGQLETYSVDEKNYKIAFDQFENYQTLVSIEDLVKTARVAMTSRSEVLKTHLTLKKLQLIEAEGVELSEKQTVLDKIEVSLLELESHINFLETANDRDAINTAAEQFLAIGENAKQTSYHAVILLSIAKLQTVYDKAVTIKSDLASLSGASNSVLDQSEKTRAISETERVLAESDTDLKALWDRVINRNKQSQFVSLLASLNRDLDPIYVNLVKAVSYLSEFLAI